MKDREKVKGEREKEGIPSSFLFNLSSQTVWRSFFALGVIVVSLFASSWFFLPVTNVVVTGNKNLDAKEVARLAGVARGQPWLWVSVARAGNLAREPWVRQAKIIKKFPNTVEIQLLERVPLATWKHEGRLEVIAEDGMVLPTGTAKLRLEGESQARFPEALLVARTARDMGAERVKFDSNGFVVGWKSGEVWSESHDSLLKYGESVRMMVMQSKTASSSTKRVNVYSWGVSVQ